MLHVLKLLWATVRVLGSSWVILPDLFGKRLERSYDVRLPGSGLKIDLALTMKRRISYEAFRAFLTNK
jgi:hypothetical protein